MGLKERAADWVFSGICTWSPVPYLTDQEVMCLLAGQFGIDALESLPGIEARTLDDYNLLQKLMTLAPYLDKEVSKFFTLGFIDIFEMVGSNSDSDPSLDDPYYDRNRSSRGSGNSGGSNRSGVTGGMRQAHENVKVNVDQKAQKAGEHSYKAILLLVFVVLPMVLLVGLGTLGSYMDYGGEVVGDQYLAGVGTQLEGVVSTYTEARGRVFCLLEGPACLRQYRMNETSRPGSDEVGQTYGLKIDRFQVAQGEQLNIAHRTANYRIPISFTISNPRHGLKGINAQNVDYRLRMIDTDRDEDNPYCDTGWVSVEDAYDSGDGDRDDIFPGTSASTGYLTITEDGEGDSVDAARDGFTLKDCELLQPALGSHRTVLLSVKYDYFSQATLNFDAMSQENFNSNPELQKEWAESETADTPAKAAINVNEPVIFGEDSGEVQPFSVRSTLNTNQGDVRYRINDLVVRNSEYVQRNSESSCSLEAEDGTREFGSGGSLVPNDGIDGQARSVPPSGELSTDRALYGGVSTSEDGAAPDSARANMISDSTNRSSNYYWFDQNEQPPIAGCVMELSDPGAIDPTGETLTMGVAANYTVSKRYRLGSFEALNSRCSDMNCPLIVTSQDNMTYSPDGEEEAYNFKTECRGLDAGNGCSIVEPSLEDWGSAGTYDNQNMPLNKRVQTGSGPDGWDISRASDDEIESGEVAVAIEDQISDGDMGTGETYYGGLDKTNLRQMNRNMIQGEADQSDEGPSVDPFAVIHYLSYDGEYEMEIDDSIPDSYCEEGIDYYRERQAKQEINVLVWHCPGSGGGGGDGGFWGTFRDIMTTVIV